MILEGVVTTTDRNGTVNVAPMGPLAVDDNLDSFLLMPFKTSTTYKNLKAHPEGVFHVVDDVELIAKAVIGEVNPPMTAAGQVRGHVLSGACRYYEFRVEELDDRDERTTIRVRTVARGRLRDFIGFNRAKHAVVEGAILASRLGILPLESIEAEFERLAVLVKKTGGEVEARALALLRREVQRERERQQVQGVRVTTGSRLHFGLLSPWVGEQRRHGGIGMMVDTPRIEVTAALSESLSVTGAYTDRTRDVAKRVLGKLVPTGEASVRLSVETAAPEHSGLGVGTQLALAVARAIDAVVSPRSTPSAKLASLSGRGLRSAIGIHGFDRGGFLVDGGHATPVADRSIVTEPEKPAPLVSWMPVPESWRIVLVQVPGRSGFAGSNERDAFDTINRDGTGLGDRRARTADLCREIVLALLPALAEKNVRAFGAALWELQQKVGEIFSTAQGGIFATPEVEEVVLFLRSDGIPGTGQSSWGPTVFAVCEDEDEANAVASRVREKFALSPGSVIVTRPRNSGAVTTWESRPPPTRPTH